MMTLYYKIQTLKYSRTHNNKCTIFSRVNAILSVYVYMSSKVVLQK